MDFGLREGMSKDEVAAILGEPGARDTLWTIFVRRCEQNRDLVGGAVRWPPEAFDAWVGRESWYYGSLDESHVTTDVVFRWGRLERVQKYRLKGRGGSKRRRESDSEDVD